MSDVGHGRRFGALLRLHRSASGLTQEELAELSQLSVRAISDMERSRTARPRRRSVLRLADALQLSESDRGQLVSASRAAEAREPRREAGQPETRLSPDPAGAHTRVPPRQAAAARAGARRGPDGMTGRGAMPPVPRQLPPAVPHFTGRQAELATLTALLDRTGGSNGSQPTMVISAIGGTAGIGKTALAVRWAHGIAERFPDGQLYVNLRGYHPAARPVGQAAAIRGFLGALNVPPARVPASLEEQTALYRSLLAGRRMLIVLDNARDAQHARPLLPGCADCLVIITSRSQLAGLVAAEGAHLLSLGLLSDEEARELLAARLKPARVAGEPAALHELARLCAGLPLALNIVAARAAARPRLSLTAFAAELRDNRALLDALDTGDPVASVRAVFSWSFQNLTDQAARMFRLLGVHPGPDISTAAATRLAGTSPQLARRALAELASMNILAEHSAARFALHDLLRAYAIEEGRVRGCDRHAARSRMLDYYMHTAHDAALLLNPSRDVLALTQPRGEALAPELHDSAEALAWFETEHAVLLAIIADAATAGLDHHVGQISWSMADYLDRRGHWHDWAATQRFAVAAAQRAGDREAEARACRGLGRAHTELRTYQAAQGQLSLAVDLYGQLRDTVGQGRTHLALARLWEYQDQHALALRHAQQALDLFRAAGHPSGQASARNAVGWHRAHLGSHAQAIGDCQQALVLYHSLADTRGEAATNDSLGYAYHHLGSYAQARRCYQAAVDLFRNLGDKYNEASSLSRLGDVHQDAGNPGAAFAVWKDALAVLSDLDHPDAEQVRAKLRRGHLVN